MNPKLATTPFMPAISTTAQQYMPALLQQANAAGLLTPAQHSHVMQQVGALLQNTLCRYALGQSSSVLQETAQSLLQGQLYCIGYALKQCGTSHAALQMLLAIPLQQLAKAGRLAIQRSVASARRHWLAAKANALRITNQPYHCTIKGLGVFFARYNPEYEAHETPCDIDYPLALPHWETSGIEYIAYYLQAFLYENTFLHHFTPPAIHRVLSRLQLTYQTLPLNICTALLLYALGCRLCGLTQYHTPPPASRVQRFMGHFTQHPYLLQPTLATELTALLAQFGIAHRKTQNYLQQTLASQFATMHASVQQGNLQTFFLLDDIDSK